MNRAQQIHLQIEKTKREVLPATLIAVTKYSPVEEVVFAYHADHQDFGENRVQDLSEKALYFERENLDKVRWHFIGHLQTNKVKELLRLPHLFAIHSVDSLKLVQELIKRASELRQKPCRLFFQVNTSLEDEKGGFTNLDELRESIKLILNDKMASNAFIVCGLMTMATIRTDDIEGEAHRCFKSLQEMKTVLESEFHISLKLSMGMSQDHHIAKQYGADYVRIGSQIFK